MPRSENLWHRLRGTKKGMDLEKDGLLNAESVAALGMY